MNILLLAASLTLQDPFFLSGPNDFRAAEDFLKYHQIVVQADSLIVERNYKEALSKYRELFREYNSVFLREYKVAAQLAVLEEQPEEAFLYVLKGIEAGWDMKSIGKNHILEKLRSREEWKDIVSKYPSARAEYEKGINPDLRKSVQKLFKKDQRMALKALFAIGSKARERYAEKRFAPHSERQMKEFNSIMREFGWPGEKLIGNNYWMAVIVSHHNSISQAYEQRDTLYSAIRPKLLTALRAGQMSPYEFAMFDGWYLSAKNKQKGYGYLTDKLTSSEKSQANELRRSVGLGSVEMQNKMADTAQRLNFNFYLLIGSGTITVAD